MTNRRSVANFLQVISFFVRSANIDIIITDIIGGTNFTPLRLSKMLSNFDNFAPSIRHAYSRYEYSQRQNIGAYVFISGIGVADRICRMNIRFTCHRLIKK
jgi:hypothetical protein